MAQLLFDGPVGLERLKALMRVAITQRPNNKASQAYFFGWLQGLADSEAISYSVFMGAQQFVANRDYEQAAVHPDVELYDYPNPSYIRVEGKDLGMLETEILAGGPHEESRVGRIYALAADEQHSLHFVAKHYLFLSRVYLSARSN